MTEAPEDSILGLILEDLRFYRELNLTVKEIQLGEMAYYSILRDAPIGYGFTPDHCDRLFGLPLKRLADQGPWHRNYLIAESHVQTPKQPSSSNA